ncbi:MAG: response regulator [Alteromonadaceae bacterium]|nr:response regulator [Alteromonadaceae bacterium]
MSFSVLICDDSKLGRKSVQRCLPEGFATEIHLAEHGQQALDVLRSEAITILFLDLTMPVMDGVQVLEAIKAEKIEVFVLVVSGDVQPQMQQRVLNLGALDFIQKPLTTEKLLDSLGKYGLY